MKRLFFLFYLTIFFSLQSLAFGEEKITVENPELFRPEIVRKEISRDNTAFETFKKEPWLEKGVRKAKKDFSLKKMTISTFNVTYELKGGKTVTLIICSNPREFVPDHIIAFDKNQKKAFILVPDVKSDNFVFVWGNPDPEVKRVMIWHLLWRYHKVK